ncbi:MAG: rhomboid family intramembrane serine protease, partial [Bacteroidia bacterium]
YTFHNTSIMDFLATPVATFILACTVITSVMGFSDKTLLNKFLLIPYRVKRMGEYDRMVMSGLIHADEMHLLMNMLTFYFFAFPLEQIMQGGTIYGSWRFLLFYVLALIISDIPTTLKHKDNPAYASLGASGAVSAVLTAVVTFKPDLELSLYFMLPIKGWLYMILYIGYSYYASRNRYDNINHDAHLWGAVSGVVLGLLLSENIRNGLMFWVSSLLGGEM